jgi:hypothetical protein
VQATGPERERLAALLAAHGIVAAA